MNVALKKQLIYNTDHGCQTLESTRRLLRVYEFTSVPRVNSVVNSFFSKLGADSVDSEWTRANSRVWSELREFSWKKYPQNNIIFTVNHFRDLLPFMLARAFFLSPSKPHTVTQSRVIPQESWRATLFCWKAQHVIADDVRRGGVRWSTMVADNQTRDNLVHLEAASPNSHEHEVHDEHNPRKNF